MFQALLLVVMSLAGSSAYDLQGIYGGLQTRVIHLGGKPAMERPYEKHTVMALDRVTLQLENDECPMTFRYKSTGLYVLDAKHCRYGAVDVIVDWGEIRITNEHEVSIRWHGMFVSRGLEGDITSSYTGKRRND